MWCELLGAAAFVTLYWGILRHKGIKPWSREAAAFKRTTDGFLVLWFGWSAIFCGMWQGILGAPSGAKPIDALDVLVPGIVMGLVVAGIWRM